MKKVEFPFVKCGKVFEPELPDQLRPYEPSILLAEVRVNPKKRSRPCILVKYSEFITLSFLGLNPKLTLTYRLVRETNSNEKAQILEEWDFGFDSLEVFEVTTVDTNQPTVLTFCDCLDDEMDEDIIYKLEIVQIDTNSVKNFAITNQLITATVIQGEVQ